MPTHQQILTSGASANDLGVALGNLQESDTSYGFGDLIAEFAPRWKLRENLTSQTAHVEERPGLIRAVLNGAGNTELTVKHVGAAGAGEVVITYDATTGVPTLTFNAAVTTYRVLKIEAPAGLLEKLAATYR